MERFKKLHLSLCAIFLTTGIVSSASAIATAPQVRQHGGWFVELEPFWAKSKDSLLSTLPFATSNFTTFDDIIGVGEFFTQDNVFHHFDPDTHWGYRVALGYDYPTCNCCNYGFSLEYTYHKSDDDKHLARFVQETGAPALDDFHAFFDVDSTDVDANYDYKYHAIDLLGHKNMTVCNCVDVQLFAGARYVHLRENYDRHFFVPDDLFDAAIDSGSDVSESFISNDNKFDGIGPRVGFNAFYQVYCGFGLTTEVAGNLLFGRSESNFFQTLFDQEAGVEDEIDTTVSRHDSHIPQLNHIVPGLSGKVALAYRTIFRNCSSLELELGYRGDKYFGISNHAAFIQGSDFDSSFVKGGIFHDFDVSGPYFNISFHA